MANSDKNILITPNRNDSGKPEIALTGFGNSTAYIRVPDSTTATLEFESGINKKFFSLDSNFSSGDILSINDDLGVNHLSASKSGNVRLSAVGTDIVSGTGLKLPVFDSNQIPNGEEGQLIYDRTEKCVKLYTNTGWVSLSSRQYVRNGLVLNYDSSFSYPGSGTLLYDISGYNYTGTLINGPTYTTENGGSLVFDGANDYVSVTTIGNPITAITLESWINPRRAPSTGTIRGGAISGNPSHYFGIFDSIDGGVTHSLHFALDTTVTRPGSQVGNIPRNVWSHIMGTYDGSRMKAYVNGVLLYDVALTGTITGNGLWIVGGYQPAPTDGTHNFDGNISVARIYRRALTQSEVSQNFNALRGRFGI